MLDTPWSRTLRGGWRLKRCHSAPSILAFLRLENAMNNRLPRLMQESPPAVNTKTAIEFVFLAAIYMNPKAG
ncbi:MAG: hypothetical protein CMM01_07710 [Rhodopirellula sp.]|nr:hypothetical protein [Rhodopirellula sp.]